MGLRAKLAALLVVEDDVAIDPGDDVREHQPPHAGGLARMEPPPMTCPECGARKEDFELVEI